MKISWFKAHRLFVIIFSITIIHFVLTSVIGHYFAIQIGTQVGQVVADKLIEAYESKESSEENVKRIHQDMKKDSDEIIDRWKIPLLLLSLPSKPITRPLIKKIEKTWIYNPVLSREISRDQFKNRGMFIENIFNFLNSLSFSLLVYLVAIFSNKVIRKKKDNETISGKP